jgi:hypothetical protein
VGLKHRIEGRQMFLDLLHDDEWEPRLQAKPPRILMAHGDDAAAAHEIAWERLSPGHYQASVTLKEGEMVRGAVQLGGAVLSFGPTILGGSAEWAFDESRVEDLRRTSAASGGRELLDLSQAWRNPKTPRFASLQPLLLLTALLLFLVDALITRTGWTMPLREREGWRFWKPQARAAGEVFRKHRERLRESPEARMTGPFVEFGLKDEQADSGADADRRSRFARAKKKP